MLKISLDDYYSAGYFLIRKNQRPSWLDEPVGLVPDELISLETEFCPKLSVGWGWVSGSKTQALQFGIDDSQWEEFKTWCGAPDKNEIEIWSMFRSTDAIRRFIDTFIPKTKQDEFTIIGVGLDKSCIDYWQEEPHDTEGVETRVLQQLPMELGGQLLGFDISSYAHHDFFHTWFSHGHHRGVFNELGIRPGKFGLLQTREEAILARDYADSHDGFFYEYWLLVEYFY